MRTLFGKIYDDTHTFVQTKLPVKMKILEAIYIRQCIDLLEGLLGSSNETSMPLYNQYHNLLYRNKFNWNFLFFRDIARSSYSKDIFVCAYVESGSGAGVRRTKCVTVFRSYSSIAM